jgi:hypothetical protein
VSRARSARNLHNTSGDFRCANSVDHVKGSSTIAQLAQVPQHRRIPMSLPKDFDKTVAALSDDELREMLADYENYTPEAIDVARNEVARRELPMESIAPVRRAVEEKRERLRAERAEKEGTPEQRWFWRSIVLVKLTVVFTLLLLKSCN